MRRFLAPLGIGLWFLTSMAEAKTVVHDPQNQLAMARSYLGTTPFETAFRCGDSAALKAFVISCEAYQAGPDWATMQCKTISDSAGLLVNRLVVGCSADEVSFMIDASGDSTTVTRSQFDEANQNVADLFLNSLDDFTGYSGAELTIDSVIPGTYVLARDSAKQRTVSAVTIAGKFGEPGKLPFNVIVTVIKDDGKNAPGVAQVARFRMNNQTWFLVDDFTGAQQ